MTEYETDLLSKDMRIDNQEKHFLNFCKVNSLSSDTKICFVMPDMCYRYSNSRITAVAGVFKLKILRAAFSGHLMTMFATIHCELRNGNGACKM